MEAHQHCDSKTSGSKVLTFEEQWPLLQAAVDKLINQIEEGIDNSIFSSEDYMSHYTIVHQLCTDRQGEKNSKLLYDQYKKVFEEYINSTVLPFLREKNDELLLMELVRRWSNYKTMTKWLSRLFHFLDRYYIPRWSLSSLEETSFLLFYDLVYEEMNRKVADAVLSMIDRDHAGEQTDLTLVNNVLAINMEIENASRKDDALLYPHAAPAWITSHSFKDYTFPEEANLHDNPTRSMKIKLKSSDGDVFEVDYSVAIMSQTIKQVIETGSAGETIPLYLVSSRMLAKVIEYCQKHNEASKFEDRTMNDDLKRWDDGLVEVDYATLFDLILTANYMEIRSLLDLASGKVADMIKGKSPEEIRKLFNIKDDFSPE
ncbi:hypothetical protein L6164_012562 [Bauhinia variegata]|uniref:Uncharacterized protein n=1 Tax=Bauhinia variegata TaxID=167791 RepID=A0ACB9PBM8_BAUVA|nr:hypothetical protein L6164_012562 [Bauhinia variegata]